VSAGSTGRFFWQAIEPPLIEPYKKITPLGRGSIFFDGLANRLIREAYAGLYCNQQKTVLLVNI
jgi:hypothetical protein